MNLELKVKVAGEHIARKTAGAAGFDIYAKVDAGTQHIAPGWTAIVHTGVHLEIPEGWMGMVLPRSSFALQGYMVSSPPIDSDYRGEVRIIVHNLTDAELVIRQGDRIAQLVFMPHLQLSEHVDFGELSWSERGYGGFGSTGAR